MSTNCCGSHSQSAMLNKVLLRTWTKIPQAARVSVSVSEVGLNDRVPWAARQTAIRLRTGRTHTCIAGLFALLSSWNLLRFGIKPSPCSLSVSFLHPVNYSDTFFLPRCITVCGSLHNLCLASAPRACLMSLILCHRATVYRKSRVQSSTVHGVQMCTGYHGKAA